MTYDTIFPNNLVNLLYEKLQTIEEDDEDLELFVCRRPLRSSDPNNSIGIWGAQVVDNPNSHETGGRAVMGGGRMGGMSHAPTILGYVLNLQVMVTDGDEERGLATHAALAQRVRRMLVHNYAFGVSLAELVVVGTDVPVSTERTTGVRRIQSQRFYNNEVSGSFVYVATFEYLVETETA